MLTTKLKKRAHFYKLVGFTWRAVYLELREKHGYKGMNKEFDAWRKTEESKNIRLDMLCAIDAWIDKDLYE